MVFLVKCFLVKQRELIKRQEEDSKKLEKELRNKYDRKIVAVRDEARQNVEESKVIV